jgi:hypothetical protein
MVPARGFNFINTVDLGIDVGGDIWETRFIALGEQPDEPVFAITTIQGDRNYSLASRSWDRQTGILF